MNRTQKTERIIGTDFMAWRIATANTRKFYTDDVVLYAYLKRTGMLRRFLHLGCVVFSDFVNKPT